MKLFSKDVDWHNKALSYVREKRDIASKSTDEWEQLRESASKIKAHTLSMLDTYLEEFEKNATKNGIKVHWAQDSDEFNKTVEKILRQKKAKKIVKSKSMLTEECGLNHYLEKKGYEVIDTDLGERIVQLRKERPSHIVLPAIHLKKEEVAKTFKENISDPKYLTNKAREDLRKHFLSADVAITGVNFAIAKEGAFVVCTNEGNADLGTSLCDTHIACMGIEKIIPELKHLAIFIRLLARSATGQPITTYTSHFKKPQENKEIHIIIVDNERSKLLDSELRESLKCIRCGACMNTCPVFRRAGGHNYEYVIPGPIGSVIAPAKDSRYFHLSFASTLCGSCRLVCPSKIKLDELLLKQRKTFVKQTKKELTFLLAFKILKNPKLYNFVVKNLKFIPHFLYKKAWGEKRVMPKAAKKSFREIYNENI